MGPVVQEPSAVQRVALAGHADVLSLVTGGVDDSEHVHTVDDDG